MDMELDRKSFLKIAAATGVMVATAGVAACSGGSVGNSTSNSNDQPEQGSAKPGIMQDIETKVPQTTVLHTWDKSPATIQDSEISKVYDADVVVVGLGNAGINSAYGAAQAGAKVIGIEKQGSFSAAGVACCGINTKYQQAAGVSLSKSDIIEAISQSANYKNSQKLVTNWANSCNGVVEDMISKIESNSEKGWFLDKKGAYGKDLFNTVFPDVHFLTTTGKIAAYTSMLKDATKTGSEFLYNTEGYCLIKENGKVIGVIAKDGNGDYIKVNAKDGVVIASGDYNGNQEMIDAWAPMLNNATGNVWLEQSSMYNEGSGILMGLWAGASMQHGPAAPMVHPVYDGGELFQCAFLRVNRDGRRFQNEDIGQSALTNTVMSVPGSIAWTIMDANFESQAASMSDLSKANQTGAGPMYYLPFLDGMDAGLPEQSYMDHSIEKGQAFKADTLDGLAKMIGVDTDTFLATVKRYNSLVAAGADTDFGKPAVDLKPIEKAPFYASRCAASILAITSGLNIDEHYRVLDKEDQVIEGLYAVGNASGNFYCNDYPISVQGSSTSRAMTQGRVCGDAVARGVLAHLN